MNPKQVRRGRTVRVGGGGRRLSRSGRDGESLATQKQRIATSGTHELTDATSKTDPAVDRYMYMYLPIDREMSLEGNGICVGEHRREVC